MKLATYLQGGAEQIGVVTGDRIVPIDVSSMLELIGDAGALSRARTLLDSARAESGVSLTQVTLLAPLPHPARNVFCVGRNYRLHIEEGARARGAPVDYPDVPEFFTKATNTVIGTGAEVRLPGVTDKLDYEVELAFVIGKRGRDIKAGKAGEHIVGYTVLNDVTARDLQRRHNQWFKGKSLDSTCPIGPWIVTSDEFDVAKDHRIWLTVNGEERQNSLTTDMVFDCASILEHLSAGLTMEVGDIVTTGTPSGVGLGLEPQVWLKDGDVMEAGIEGIGSITNTVRAVQASGN
jgi:2-keto-4-pentenoate hydratase/2-oxohepta-3-ene-1,7-dioic acid hydratase in catechol pathway